MRYEMLILGVFLGVAGCATQADGVVDDELPESVAQATAGADTAAPTSTSGKLGESHPGVLPWVLVREHTV